MSSLSPAQWRGHQCSAGAKGPLLLQWSGRSPDSAEELFPVPRQDNTQAGQRKGAAGHFPLRKHTRWSGSCCSLFLFDLQHVWSPAGSLSWPQHCLITCSKAMQRRKPNSSQGGRD